MVVEGVVCEKAKNPSMASSNASHISENIMQLGEEGVENDTYNEGISSKGKDALKASRQEPSSSGASEGE